MLQFIAHECDSSHCASSSGQPQYLFLPHSPIRVWLQVTKEHVRAGDVFQLVLSQRFERSTYADPFEVYRALRIVNPSPYMAYMQVRA
jgi:anthranilate/para-aminobenzoate synthase component I